MNAIDRRMYSRYSSALPDTLDIGDGRPEGEALPITSTQSSQLWDALCRVYDRLGFAAVTGGDEVFRSLVLARLVEPVSKLDTIRVLTELGIDPPGYRTIFRRLPEYAKDEWRQQLARACAEHVGLGPATLVLYDVTTLYFETDEGDGFREPGFSKERRLEPQITVGLLTDARGFPLQVHAFTGNTAETKTMIPVIKAFIAAYSLPGVTVVADAGMMSEANCKDLEDAGLTFIVGARIIRRCFREEPTDYEVQLVADPVRIAAMASPSQYPSRQVAVPKPSGGGVRLLPEQRHATLGPVRGHLELSSLQEPQYLSGDRI